jgi:hypothetical protein
MKIIRAMDDFHPNQLQAHPAFGLNCLPSKHPLIQYPPNLPDGRQPIFLYFTALAPHLRQGAVRRYS